LENLHLRKEHLEERATHTPRGIIQVTTLDLRSDAVVTFFADGDRQCDEQLGPGVQGSVRQGRVMHPAETLLHLGDHVPQFTSERSQFVLNGLAVGHFIAL
jgi:hypothetical protein